MSKGSLWQQLENTLKTKIDEFDGVAGVSLKSFSSGKHISINGDEIFPTASTIKIH
ncbi:MAG: serine hydrolase, partial [SAR202 cluster bacterium]